MWSRSTKQRRAAMWRKYAVRLAAWNRDPHVIALREKFRRYVIYGEGKSVAGFWGEGHADALHLVQDTIRDRIAAMPPRPYFIYETPKEPK